MDNLFLTILNMSLTGAFVIAAICLARLPLKKAPKIISYCLWAVAWLRLAVPISIESALSLIPFRAAPLQQAFPIYQVPVMPPEIAVQIAPSVGGGALPEADIIGNVIPSAVQASAAQSMHMWLTVGAIVWITGFALMLSYGIISYLHLKTKMKSATLIEDGIYETGEIQSPFVLGIIRPKIYIPLGLTPHERTYVLLHERTHVHRCDHIIKFAAYFILCLHWFNPLAWIAFLLMSVDMEMSCDERVLKEMGGDVKQDYSKLLLSLSVNWRAVGGSPLAFSEGGLKARIRNVLNFKKSSKVIVTVAAMLTVALSVGLLVNGTEGSDISAQPPQRLDDYSYTASSDIEEINEGEINNATGSYALVASDVLDEDAAEQEEQEQQEAGVFGRIREATTVYRTDTSLRVIGYEFGHVDFYKGQIFEGTIVEVIGPWSNGRVPVVVTSEGGHEAHNGWQNWQLWIDSDSFDIVDYKIDRSNAGPPTVASNLSLLGIMYHDTRLSDFTIREGQDILLHARLEPVDTPPSVEITWSSSDTDVFEVVPINTRGDEAVVIGVGEGTAVLTLTVGDAEITSVVRVR